MVEERAGFLWVCGPWLVSHVPVDHPIYTHLQAPLNRISGLYSGGGGKDLVGIHGNWEVGLKELEEVREG